MTRARMEKVDDIIQTIDNTSYNALISLAETNYNRKSYDSLQNLCSPYGITADEFIEWYEG